MQNVPVWVATIMQSNADGSPKKVISSPFSALGAKSMELFLNITEIDSDTEVVI